MERCTISPEAYLKAVLHASKYSSLTVGGFLLGQRQKKDGDVLHIVDVLPINHGNPVGPIFEVAGAMVRRMIGKLSVYVI